MKLRRLIKEVRLKNNYNFSKENLIFSIEFIHYKKGL